MVLFCCALTSPPWASLSLALARSTTTARLTSRFWPRSTAARRVGDAARSAGAGCACCVRLFTRTCRCTMMHALSWLLEQS